jgi:hypothetical protein
MKTPPPSIRPSIQFIAALTSGVAIFYVIKVLFELTK